MKKETGLKVVDKAEAVERYGVMGVVTSWGYDLEGLWEEMEVMMMDERVNPGSGSYVIQTDVVAASVYNRDVCMMEDVIERNGVGKNWCCVGVSAVVFRSDGDMERWIGDDRLVMRVDRVGFDNQGRVISNNK